MFIYYLSRIHIHVRFTTTTHILHVRIRVRLTCDRHPKSEPRPLVSDITRYSIAMVVHVDCKFGLRASGFGLRASIGTTDRQIGDTSKKTGARACALHRNPISHDAGHYLTQPCLPNSIVKLVAIGVNLTSAVTMMFLF
jgi:hypothetical protein